MKSNKSSLHRKILKKIQQHKFYGTTIVGERGQIVIPAQARKDMHLMPGDQILVVGRGGKMACLIKADQLQEIFKTFMSFWTGSAMEHALKKQAKKTFGRFLRTK